MSEVKRKVLFVINKKSGDGIDSNLESTILHHSKKKDYEACIYYLELDNLKNGIKNQIKNFHPDIVAAAGGDGTVALVAGIVNRKNIALLIIPKGSANGMSKELQMPEDLNACLNLITEGKVVAIDLLKVNDKLSIHLADVGLNARIVKRFHLDNKRGLITYAKHLFNEAFLIGYKRFQISHDGKIKNVKAVSLTFANATKYGTGAVINPDGKLNDGRFEICIVKPFPRIHIFTIAVQMFRNKLKFSEYFEVIHCKKATVKCKRKTLLQIDGEICGKVNLIDLECMPGVLKVLIPARLQHPTLVD